MGASQPAVDLSAIVTVTDTNGEGLSSASVKLTVSADPTITAPAARIAMAHPGDERNQRTKAMRENRATR